MQQLETLWSEVSFENVKNVENEIEFNVGIFVEFEVEIEVVKDVGMNLKLAERRNWCKKRNPLQFFLLSVLVLRICPQSGTSDEASSSAKCYTAPANLYPKI
jgi:hypothetical protein